MSTITEHTTAYHITTDDALPGILSQGLHPAIGERSAALGEDAPRVYLFPTEDDLLTALGSWLGECFDMDTVLHVLSVDTHNLTLDSTVGWELTCATPITPDRLTYLRTE